MSRYKQQAKSDKPRSMPKTKVCTKCGVEKPLGEYHARKRGKDGKQSACKECHRAVCGAWYANNKERQREYYAAWYAANKERKAAWYEANREDCILRAVLNRDIRGGA